VVVADHRAVGKLFKMTGPASWKLLVRSVVVALSTDSDMVPVDGRCRLPAMVEVAKQLSAKNDGAKPRRELYTSVPLAVLTVQAMWAKI